jgi:hypothetical protein
MALRASGRSWIIVQTAPFFSILTVMIENPFQIATAVSTAHPV